MKCLFRCTCLLLLAGTAARAEAQSVRLDVRDAVVWSHEQVVRGHAEGTGAAGTLFVNDLPVAFTAPGAFAVAVRLGEGENEIVACAEAAGAPVCSDTVRWTLGYRLRPELYTYATVEGSTVTLHGRVLDNPGGDAATFAWAADPANPQPLVVSVTSDTLATVAVPAGAAPGEYYFDWTATTPDGDTARARTFVTVDEAGVRPFDLTRDHAAWIDRAMIYEIQPSAFQRNGRLDHITARLPELVDLGVNTLWLQPIFVSRNRGQGYDIVEYFGVRGDVGTRDDLAELVEAAHALGLRVLLDFVPNHTSVHHPYAADASTHGAASHYYDFYQRTPSDARYSNDEHTRRVGEMDFVYYFWEDLVNLNYDNPEVRRWMEEAGRYWIEEYDVDGYRIDAAWGVNARTPEAMQDWRFALKRLKPEVLLLGEDKATLPHAFDNRFDVAYDWTPDEGWVSHWAWQYEYSDDQNLTFFNHPDARTSAGLLRAALTNDGRGFPEGAKVLRFMENNDLFRFIATHSLEATKAAATLLYALPGVPLLYNGQEIGFGAGNQPDHPYETGSIFRPDVPIREQDTQGLYPFYQRLLTVRRDYAALHAEGGFEEVTVNPSIVGRYVYAFHRWAGDEHLFAAVNLSDDAANVRLRLPVESLGLDEQTTYYLTDLLTGEYVSGQKSDLASAAVTLPGTTARLFVLDDEVVHVPTAAEPGGEVPRALALLPNYPNPFNPSTTIRFELPAAGHVRLVVYDVLGRQVAVLADGVFAPGLHRVDFDAGALAGGVYFYQLVYGGERHARRMILLK